MDEPLENIPATADKMEGWQDDELRQVLSIFW